MQSRGYEVARRVAPKALCGELRRAALAAAREQQRHATSWFAAMQRLAGIGSASGASSRPVRAPAGRVHVMMPLCTKVQAVLSAALCPTDGLGNAAFRCGLTPAARLVELSVMVVLPGAEDQAAHTDVPPHTVQRMATLWVALQDVDRTLGPTMVYESNPSDLATRFDWAALQREGSCHISEAAITTYGPEGFAEEIPLDLHDSSGAASSTTSLPDSVADLGLGDPIAVEMGVGDAMLMDVRTFHYGSANTCQGGDDVDDDAGCRVQLSATFEEPMPHNTADTGFTYELREELRNKYVLGDFLSTA